jgi:hypothetical protein
MSETKWTPGKAMALCAALTISGCDATSIFEAPFPASHPMKNTPVTIIESNEQGVILCLGDGSLLQMRETYYVAQTIMAGDFKAGDVIGGNEPAPGCEFVRNECNKARAEGDSHE